MKTSGEADGLREFVKTAKALLAAFRSSFDKSVTLLAGRAEKFLDVIPKVGESWSGSWAGYHARLYYKAFQRPPLDDAFSVEWGGVRGLPDGWQDRSPDEVRAVIESMAGGKIETIEGAIQTVRRGIEDLRHELVIAASPLAGHPEFAKEQTLLTELETVTFGEPRASYVARRRPGQIASRDSNALFQGVILPAHIFFEAVATEAATLAEAVEKFLRLADRLVRQVELKLAHAASAGSATTSARPARERSASKVFLVHGHDSGAKETVARFLEKLNLTVVVLHEQPDRSRTIIEKFEDHADVDYAVVLLTPDDVGSEMTAPGELKPRARQNVILELGFFLRALGRARVVALKAPDVEVPSDLSGVLYIPLGGEDWKLKVAREMKNAGLDVDLNRAL